MRGQITSRLAQMTTLIVVATFAYIFSAIARGQHAELMRLATRDPLTGAGNRRALEEKLEELIRERRRNPAPASLITSPDPKTREPQMKKTLLAAALGLESPAFDPYLEAVQADS